jgi:hypothetical protein
MNSNLPSVVKKLLSLPTPLARDIADFRFAHRISTEAAAMRRLLAAGLKASEEAPAQRTKQNGES